MNHRLLFLLLAAMVSGCSLIGERAPGPKVVAIKPNLGGCSFPEKGKFTDLTRLSGETLYLTFDCAKQKLDSAFDQVKGARSGEISVKEIRTLVKSGLLKFEIEKDAEWDWLSQFVATLHPEGRPALNQQAAVRVLATLRELVPLYLDWIHAEKNEDGNILPASFVTLLARSIDSAHGVIDLLSPNWSLTLAEAQRLAAGFKPIAERIRPGDTVNVPTLLETVESVWILKSLFLADRLEQGARSDLRLDSLQALLHALLQAVRVTPETQRWAAAGGHASQIPLQLGNEWGTAAQVVQTYFAAHKFAGIDSDTLAWSLRRLKMQGLSANSSADLVRLSQRLAPPRGPEGLHPLAFPKLLEVARSVGDSLVKARPNFPDNCGSTSVPCTVSVRNALKDPALKGIALKGINSVYHYGEEPLRLRSLDVPLELSEVALRFTKLGLVKKIFQTFDSQGLGKLPLTGLYQEDLKDTLDLTYTLLRFLSFGGQNKDPIRKEEPLPAMMPVRPSALYKLMGLLGDRWMPDGNHDDALNADELFSVVQFYEEHARVATSMAFPYQIPHYLPEQYLGEPDVWRFWNDNSVLTERTPFVRGLFPAFLEQRHLARVTFKDVRPETMDSLFHAIVSLTPRKPIKAIRFNGTFQEEKKLFELKDYVNGSEALGPAAILLAMDKLDLVCDKDENLKFDWNELDCLTPLALSAAYHVITSGLVEIEPGVYDLARVLLSFLQRPGIPLSLAKFVLISGSFIGPFESFSKEAGDWLNQQSHLDWKTLGLWAWSLGNSPQPSAEKLIELGKEKFLACDKDVVDGELKGPKELRCAIDLAIGELTDSAPGLFGGKVPKATLEKFLLLVQSQVMRTAIQFGLQRPEVIAKIFAKGPLESSKQKILSVLEELLRPEKPLPRE